MQKLSHFELESKRSQNSLHDSLSRHPVTVVLPDIRSLYNVGSIFRSADAFGVQEVVLTGYTPVPPRKEISKTALGADAMVPWWYEQDTVRAVQILRERGLTVFAVELVHDSRHVSSVMLPEFPIALVLGNEVTGIEAEVLNVCNAALEIPMYGMKHSLNVAVAAGISMFAVTERYLQIKNNPQLEI